MSSFPAISPIKGSIKTKIESTTRQSFSGNKPFIQLTKYANGVQSLNYGTYSEKNKSNPEGFDLSKVQNKNERFPPIITGLDVSNSGNLGAIRKAKINVKFSDITQLERYKDFLLIGNSQMVSWGWVKSSTGTPSTSVGFAASIVVNIGNWQSAVNAAKHEIDYMAGPLVNFNFKINSDATIDAELELGSPSEIPGFLALNKKEKKTSTEAKSDGDDIVVVCQGLDLDGKLTGTTEAEIKAHTINFREDRKDKTTTFGESSDTYVQLGFGLKAILNKFRAKEGSANKLELGIDLSNSIAMGHPNMISVSENVLFPNSTTMGFVGGYADDKSRVLTPDLSTTQAFGPFNGTHEFPKDSVSATYAGTAITISGKKAGFIENMYVKIDFLKDSAKGCETVNDFLDKIIAELNVAGAGLYNLVRREISDSNSKLIYSIIDLSLSHNVTSVPDINLFGNNSRVIDISMNCDMPKEIVAMMVMDKDDPSQHDDNPGIRMFKMVKPDPVMQIAKPSIPTTGGAIADEDTTGFWASIGNFFTNAIPTFFSNAFNMPGENRVKFAASTKFGDGGTEPMFGVFKDVSCVKNYVFEKDFKRNNALVPVTVSFTLLGMSGITLGSAMQFSPSPVPWLKNRGYWQVTSVEHKVDDAQWTTMVECKYRVSNSVS
jgi:hypothetical protein